MRRAALALAVALAALAPAAEARRALSVEIPVKSPVRAAGKGFVLLKITPPRAGSFKASLAGAPAGGHRAALASPRTVRLKSNRSRRVRLALTERGLRVLRTCERLVLRATVARQGGKRRAVRRTYRRGSRGCLPQAAPGPLARKGDWPAWGFDLAGGRHNPYERKLTPAAVPKLKLKWAFAVPDADGAQSSQPAVVGDTIYFGGRNGIFYALDARSGKTRWTFDTRSVVTPGGDDPGQAPPGGGSTPPGSAKRNLLRNGPAVVDGAVYFGDFTGFMYSLDAATGKLRWATELDLHPHAIITGSPTVYDGRVYMGVSSNEVFTALAPTYPCCQARGSMVAVDAQTGKIVWRYYTVPAPQLSGTNSYGAKRYEPSGVSVWNTPAIDHRSRSLHFGTSQNYTGETDRADAMIALKVRNGRERWGRQLTKGDNWTAACLFPTPGGNCPDPGPDFDFGSSANLFRAGGRLIHGQGQKSGVYHALDARTGKIVWQTILNKASGEGGAGGQEGIQWGSAYDGRRLYVSTNIASPGTLFALDPKSGKGLWKTPNPEDGCTTGGAAESDAGDCEPALPAAVSTTPGVVWEGGRDGKMRAYAAETGRLLWEYDTARPYETVNGEAGNGGSLSGGGAVVSRGMLYVNSGYQTASSPATGISGNVLLAFGL